MDNDITAGMIVFTVIFWGAIIATLVYFFKKWSELPKVGQIILSLITVSLVLLFVGGGLAGA